MNQKELRKISNFLLKRNKAEIVVIIILFFFAVLFLSEFNFNDELFKDNKLIEEQESIVFENNRELDLGDNILDSDNNLQNQEVVILYKVNRVVDGDTIKVYINNKLESIRLIGLDTPETVDPRKKVQCFGIEASNKAKKLLSGKNVILEKDETQDERDKYGRLLLYVYLEDGTFFNKWMIENGYGHEYTYNIPYRYQAEFKNAEKYARENKLGLWADDACQ